MDDPHLWCALRRDHPHHFMLTCPPLLCPPSCASPSCSAHLLEQLGFLVAVAVATGLFVVVGACVLFVTWHLRAVGLWSANVRGRSQRLTYLGCRWGGKQEGGGNDDRGRCGGGGSGESSDMSQLGCVSRFGRGQTAGPPGWDIVILCSLYGKAFVAQLARVLAFVTMALGSILT